MKGKKRKRQERKGGRRVSLKGRKEQKVRGNYSGNVEGKVRPRRMVVVGEEGTRCWRRRWLW